MRGPAAGDARRWLLIVALVVIALLVLAPVAIAAGAGRMIGQLWVSVMGALVALFGG